MASPHLVGVAKDCRHDLSGIGPAALQRLYHPNLECQGPAGASFFDASSGGGQSPITGPDAPCRRCTSTLVGVFSQVGQAPRIERLVAEWVGPGSVGGALGQPGGVVGPPGSGRGAAPARAIGLAGRFTQRRASSPLTPVEVAGRPPSDQADCTRIRRHRRDRARCGWCRRRTPSRRGARQLAPVGDLVGRRLEIRDVQRKAAGAGSG